MAALDIELQKMAERYSAKCMELSVLEGKLHSQDRSLLIAKRRIQDLLTRFVFRLITVENIAYNAGFLPRSVKKINVSIHLTFFFHVCIAISISVILLCCLPAKLLKSSFKHLSCVMNKNL